MSYGFSAHCSEQESKLVTVLLIVVVVRELSHAVPDMSIHGSLSSVHCSLDLEHYQLIRGLLENNLGEPVEDFLRPYNLQDPSTYVRKQATSCTLIQVSCQKCLILAVCVMSSWHGLAKNMFYKWLVLYKHLNTIRYLIISTLVLSNYKL